MTSFELSDYLQKSVDILILDVREAYELDICKFEKFLHIPMMSIPNRIAEIPTDVPVVLVCHLGVRSGMAYQYLTQRGFQNIHDLTGGIDLWAATIDSNMKRY